LKIIPPGLIVAVLLVLIVTALLAIGFGIRRLSRSELA